MEEIEIIKKRTGIFLESFISPRDKVLEKLYENVKDRFVYFYKQLHDIDEEEFKARLEASNAGLDFKVDFHGRGTHPPHALHSEGHQDSM